MKRLSLRIPSSASINRQSVIIGRLYEDIALMQKAIRHNDGEALERLFSKACAIRRSIMQAKQA